MAIESITVTTVQFKHNTAANLAISNPFLLEAEKCIELDTNREKHGPFGGGYWNDLPYTDEAAIEAAGTVAAALVAPKLNTADLPVSVATLLANPETAASDAVSTLISDALAVYTPSDIVKRQIIGSVLSTPRMTYSGPVAWYQSVSSNPNVGRPVHILDGDELHYYVPTVVPWSPLELPGLAAWYDAQTLGLAADAAVPSWTDLSGLGRHAVQAAGGSQPTYKTAGLGSGKASVLFDGTADFLAATIPSYIGAWTVYLVGQSLPATLSASDYFFDGSNAAATANRLGYYRSGTLIANATRGTGFAGPALDNGIHRHRIVFNGASSSIQLDAGAASTGTTSLGGVDVVKLVLGARSDGLNWLDGHIGEAIFVQGAVSAPDEAKAVAYLQGRWGVA